MRKNCTRYFWDTLHIIGQAKNVDIRNITSRNIAGSKKIKEDYPSFQAGM